MPYTEEQQSRIAKVTNTMEALKAVAGVADAWVDDFDQYAHGFNVDIMVNHFITGDRQYRLPDVNLRSVSARCGAILRRAGLRAKVIQSPKKIYDWEDRYWHRRLKSQYYNSNRIRFDVYA